MRTSHVIKVNTLGGIFAPLKLKQILEIAYKHGASQMNIGPRQEVFLNIHKEQLADFLKQMQEHQILYEHDADVYPNLVSSYPAEGILTDDNWLTEGIYKDIFDQFDYKPTLQINICDPSQHLAPVFSGQINVVASNVPQYWFVYVKNANTMVRAPKWVYTTDVPKVCKILETLLKQNPNESLHEICKEAFATVQALTLDITHDLELPRYQFPYYEGMNRYNDKFWLGLYRRNYQFPIAFIYELCNLCIHLNIAQICTTPWRTFIIKGIQQNHRIEFEKLLGKHSINLRHSANELNWIVQDINSDEPEIKKSIIAELDQLDARTYGLVFGIKLQHSENIAASVIIEQKPFFHRDELKLMSVYDIYYTENFNPNSQIRHLFAKNVSRRSIAKHVLRLARRFYESLNEIEPTRIKDDIPVPIEPKRNVLYQCTDCLTVYDPEVGDPMQQIAPGILFKSLPATYVCGTCEADITYFKEVRLDLETA